MVEAVLTSHMNGKKHIERRPSTSSITVKSLLPAEGEKSKNVGGGRAARTSG